MNEPNWKNRTMFTGDNLDIMRGMNSESVDLIYLDPPFNSNKDYAAPIGSEAAGAAFKDTWTLDDVDLAWHGEIAEQHPALYAIIGAARESHGKGMQSYLIMMGIRLIEMKRLLKPTGSIYLHCDSTASHYLKLLMDSVFGESAFRNEITWQRYGSHNDAKKFSSVSDRILYYARRGAVWNPQRIPLDEKYVASTYRNTDKRGRFRTAPLHARTLSGGGYEYTYRGVKDVWKFPLKRLEELDADDRIYWPPKGKIPGRKVYLKDSKGKLITDVMTDITMAAGKERTGYPTQKPVALLDRIIKASSNKGAMVLDPFCGCATACVASDRLNRQWVGIDLSPLAAKLVRQRIQAEGPLLYDITHRTDIPSRTDVGNVPHYRTQRHTLFGLQEGLCNGCQIGFPFRNFTIDHVVPQSKGGTDHIDNLQLLCSACNSQKGSRSQAEFLVALKKQGTIQ